MEEKPEEDKGPFSKEEEELLEDFTEIMSSITERKRAEEKLKESEEKFRSYVENAPNGVFVVDKDGNYLEINNCL